MRNESELRSLFEQVSSLAESAQWEAFYREERSTLARFARGGITQNLRQHGATMRVRLRKGNRAARVVLDTSDPAASKPLLERQLSSLGDQPEDPELPALAEPARYRALENFCEATASLKTDEQVQTASVAIEQLRRAGFQAAGSYEAGSAVAAVANSKGLFGYHRGTFASFACTALSPDSAGTAKFHHWSLRELRPEELARKASEKARACQNPAQIDPGAYTVILEPAATASLLGFLAYHSFSGQAFHDRRSFFSGKLGQKVFGDNITVSDDPADPRTVGIPFDLEGTPKDRLPLVEKGTLLAVVYDQRTAARAKTHSTGHALSEWATAGPVAGNLILQPGTSSLEEMIRQTDRGILVTEFWYNNLLSPTELTLTGMTRNGTFWIESGKVHHGVRNLRYTECLPRILQNVEAISRETQLISGEWAGGIVAPALKVRDFHFSSATLF